MKPDSPAFPQIKYFTKETGRITSEPGIDLRTYIATMAMQAEFTGNCNSEETAQKAVEMADALIEELNKPKLPDNELSPTHKD